MGKADLKGVRRDVCAAYHREQSTCEVAAYLRGLESFQKWSLGWSLSRKTLECHHIFGRGKLCHESRSNLIMVSKMAHAWGHDVGPRDFRVLCIAAKCAKRERIGLVEEFDEAVLSEIVGVPFRGWFEVELTRVSPGVQKIGEAVIENLMRG